MNYEYEGFNVTDMWSNVLKPGETHRPHTHSNNILSGVFYVDAEQTSGIIFTDPRPQAGVIQPDVTKQFVDNANVIKYDSLTNRMILFPSWLQHYVPINETNSEIEIEFNGEFSSMMEMMAVPDWPSDSTSQRTSVFMLLSTSPGSVTKASKSLTWTSCRSIVITASPSPSDGKRT